MSRSVREHLTVRDWWCFLAPSGWATDWYFPEGVHGKVWNFLHGYGWQVM
jgi:hypothetical protein